MSMREILFRGKRVDNGEWIEGNFAERKTGVYIVGLDEKGWLRYKTVQPDTVGQYTGKTDKAWAKAFEHDCIRELYGDAIGVIRYGEYRNPFDGYEFSHMGFYVDWVSSAGKDAYRKDLGFWLSRVEIIGNIHDNQELLEGECLE